MDSSFSELVRGIVRTQGTLRAIKAALIDVGSFNPYHEIGHCKMGHVREAKSKTVSRSTSTGASTATAGSTGSDSNDGGGSDDSGGEDGGGGGDDDDPSDIALFPPVVYHVVSCGSFLNSMLLAGTAWLFKDSFLAAIPLIGGTILGQQSSFPHI